MVKVSITTLLILLCFSSISQSWQKIKSTSVYFTVNVNRSIGYDGSVNYVFFKKGDSLIIVTQDLKEKFNLIFKMAPASFDSLFKYSLITSTQFFKELKDEYAFLKNQHFSSIVQFTSLKEEDNHKGKLTWVIKNSRYYVGHNPCYLVLDFKKNGKRSLKLLSISDGGCDL